MNAKQKLMVTAATATMALTGLGAGLASMGGTAGAQTPSAPATVQVAPTTTASPNQDSLPADPNEAPGTETADDNDPKEAPGTETADDNDPKEAPGTETADDKDANEAPGSETADDNDPNEAPGTETADDAANPAVAAK